MNAALLNTAGILYALWRAGVLLLVWRRWIPTDKAEGYLVFAIPAVTGIVFHFVSLPVRGGFLIVNSVLLLLLCAWKRRSYLQEAVFVILMIYAFQTLFVLVMSGLGEVLAPLVFRSVHGGVTDAATVEREAVVYSVIFHMIGGALLGGESLLACKITGHPAKQNWTDTAYLSVLNVIGIIISFVMTDLAVVPLEHDVFILTTEKRALVWVLPVVACLIYAGELAVLYAWRRYRETLAREQRLFVEAKEKQAMERRLQETEAFQEGIRRVRHDLKNHLTNIRGLAAGGNYEALDAYITKLDESVRVPDPLVYTGNAVTDVILADKKALTEKKGIRFSWRFVMEGEPFIPVYDLGIILGNLLDNAIEACEKVEEGRRYITLEQKYKGNFMLITVENSFDGKLQVLPDGRFRSTKAEEAGGEHGYGLKNVEEIAKRYLGGVTFHHEADVFRVRVMVQRKGEGADA